MAIFSDVSPPGRRGRRGSGRLADALVHQLWLAVHKVFYSMSENRCIWRSLCARNSSERSLNPVIAYSLAVLMTVAGLQAASTPCSPSTNNSRCVMRQVSDDRMSASAKFTIAGRIGVGKGVRSPALIPSPMACHHKSTCLVNAARGLVGLTKLSFCATKSALKLLGIQRFW